MVCLAVAVFVAIGSFVTTLLGGYAALRIGSYRYLVLGLAAGLMIGADGFNTYTITSLYGNDRRRALTLLGVMYLASADILPKAHAGHRTLATVACTIGGALFMLVIVGLAS